MQINIVIFHPDKEVKVLKIMDLFIEAQKIGKEPTKEETIENIRKVIFLQVIINIENFMIENMKKEEILNIILIIIIIIYKDMK